MISWRLNGNFPQVNVEGLLVDNKSNLVLVIVQCHEAPNQYLNQHWPCHIGTPGINELSILEEDSNFWKCVSLTRSFSHFFSIQSVQKESKSSLSNFHTHANHDDVIKWKHFPRYWPFVRGIHQSPVNSPHKGQWRGALMFTLICARINGWVNTREAGDLRRYRAHYDVIVMQKQSQSCHSMYFMTKRSNFQAISLIWMAATNLEKEKTDKLVLFFLTH